MKPAFAPMAKILAIKAIDMNLALEAGEAFQKWLAKKAAGEDDEEEGARLEEIFEQALYKQRAFEGYADPEGMRRAADYSDRWYKTKEYEFNVYYVCRAGEAPGRCTLIESQKWARLHSMPHALKQRWYCRCGAKYKTKYGVICEMRIGNQRMYVKAEIPPADLQDAKCMKIQEDMAQFATPSELINALPTIKPMDKERLFIPVPGSDGHFTFDPDVDKAIDTLNWSQLYNLRAINV